MTGRRPDHGRADAHAGEPQLGDRRIHHPHRPELVEQPAAHLVGALVDADFLAHEEDVGVALHLLAQGLVERVAVGQGRHGSLHGQSAAYRARSSPSAYTSVHSSPGSGSGASSANW